MARASGKQINHAEIGVDATGAEEELTSSVPQTPLGRRLMEIRE
jgi:hypothetical protein